MFLKYPVAQTQDPEDIVLVAAQLTQFVLNVPLQVKQVVSQAVQVPLTSIVPSLHLQILSDTSRILGSRQVRQ